MTVGEGSAPGPYDVFLASIAACAGIYVLGFCQARGLATEGLSLAQSHEVDPETGVDLAGIVLSALRARMAPAIEPYAAAVAAGDLDPHAAAAKVIDALG